jgi:DNA-binding NarL/FixJ family response regulator
VPDESVDVVIVDAQDAARKGLEMILSADPRLRVTGAASTISELRTLGLPFDACLVTLAGIDDPQQVTSLMREVPVVVRAAVAPWQVAVMAWTCGARAVLGMNAGAVPLADAVCTAVAHSSAIQAELARALLDASEDRALEVPGYLTTLLDQVSRGRNARRVLATLGVAGDAYDKDLEALRESLRREGFGTLETPGPSGTIRSRGPSAPYGAIPPESARLSDGERDVLELYASGYSYPEIALRLRVSAYTVKSRVLKAMEKFEIPDGHADIRLLFALYVCGLHRKPELLRRRLDAVRAQARQREPSRRSRSLPEHRHLAPGVPGIQVRAVRVPGYLPIRREKPKSFVPRDSVLCCAAAWAAWGGERS